MTLPIPPMSFPLAAPPPPAAAPTGPAVSPPLTGAFTPTGPADIAPATTAGPLPAAVDADTTTLHLTPEQARALDALEQSRTRDLLAPASQANAVTAVWGDTGSGKTELVCTAIEYCWETFHKIARVVVADPGGFGNNLLKLIRYGIGQVWNLTNHINAFETVELATLGYWPERLLDPETGYADPYITLVPPQRRTYIVYCPNGHAFPAVNRAQLNLFQMTCPTCQVLTSLANLHHVDERVVRSRGFRDVGLWVFESGTSLNDHIMGDMADRAGRDELGGEKGAIGNIVDGSMVFGSNNRAHYGFAQIRTRQWLTNSRKIPGQVLPPIWTFRADRGSDERNSPVAGPKIAGNAKTAEVGGWVGNLIHAENVLDINGRNAWRAWLTSHRNVQEGNVLYLAKTRAAPGTFVENGAPIAYLQDEEGKPFSKFSLAYFFRQVDSAFQRQMRQSMEHYKDAPVFQPAATLDEEVVVSEAPLSTGQVTGMTAPAAPAVGGVPVAAMLMPPTTSGSALPPMVGLPMPPIALPPTTGTAPAATVTVPGTTVPFPQALQPFVTQPPAPLPPSTPPVSPTATTPPMPPMPHMPTAAPPPGGVPPPSPAVPAAVSSTSTAPPTHAPMTAPVRPPMPSTTAR